MRKAADLLTHARRASTNDSDRVRKLLARHGLSWSDLQ